MNRYLIIVLMSILLLLPSNSAVSLLPVSDMDGSQSTIVEGGGIGSGSEEVIDSFDVHPANRWTEEIDTGFTANVDNGLLNLTDMGDGTDDNYVLGRELRDLDGKIEIRFKYNFNMSSPNWQDGFQIRFADAASYGTQISLMVEMGQNNAYSTTKLRYYDVDGDFHDKGLSTTERLYDNLWYVLEFDYDVLKSQCTIECEFDNGTKVFDYDWQDISSSYRPYIFKSSVLRIGLNTRSYNDTMYSEFLFDYVKAPFKEREWTQTDTPGDAFIYDEWDACRESEDSDESVWSLTVPYLDAVSGIISANTTDNSLQTDADNIQIGVEIYGVDADDGGLHLIAGVSTGFVSRAAAFVESNYGECYDGGILQYEEKLSIASSSTAYSPLLSFSFSLKEDRSESIMTARYFPDQTNEDLYYDFAVESSISAFVTDPSQEFVISVFHNFNSIPATYDAYTFVKTFSIIERNIFTDFGKFVEGVIGGAQDVVGGGADIFTALFRWLGGMIAAAFVFVGDSLGVVFVAVGAAIVVALSPIATSLSTLASDIWSGIGNALDFLTTAIGLVTTAVEAIASDVATAVWSGIGSALDFITTAISGIAAAIWVAVLAVASDLADLVVDIIDFLIGLAGNIVSAIWDFITIATFFLWDALGLPDLLAVLDLFLVNFVELITAIPGFVIQVAPRIFDIINLGAIVGVIFLLIVPAISSDSVGEFIEKFMEYFFKDVTMGASLLGFKIPVPIGLLWMLTVITTILSSTIFGGFFT